MSESDEVITVETNSTPLLEDQYSKVRDEEERSNSKEPWKGEIVKSIVHAGIEAIFTCFSLISSISATRLSSVDVLALGIANLVADGISSSLGDFLSTSTKKDLAIKEKAVTQWEVDNHRQDQQNQLLQQYQNLGMDINDANTVVNIFSKYNDIMRDQKLTAQKGEVPPDQGGGEKPWKNGVVNFVSYVVFGSVPLSSFVVLKPFTDSDWVMFVGACFMSVIGLTLLGIAKAKIGGKSYVLSVGSVLLNGAVAASAAYVLGRFL